VLGLPGTEGGEEGREGREVEWEMCIRLLFLTLTSLTSDSCLISCSQFFLILLLSLYLLFPSSTSSQPSSPRFARVRPCTTGLGKAGHKPKAFPSVRGTCRARSSVMERRDSESEGRGGWEIDNLSVKIPGLKYIQSTNKIAEAFNSKKFNSKNYHQ
jgi:hypothetical protein